MRIESVIEEQNPWWKGRSVPDYFAPPIERPLAKHLWQYILSSNLKRHLIILGPRRVGKTTVMYQTVQHLLNSKVPPHKIQWVRLDHPVLMSLDLDVVVTEAMKLSKASNKQPLYLFLDELVYAENWDKWLKTFYDEHWPVRIIASSSAAAALYKGKESGVGRWEEFHLTPYLLTELIQLYNPNINFPVQKKGQCLHDTIKNLYQTIPHTQLDFERERKMLISLGGFPEFLSGRKREEERLWKHIDKRIKEKSILYKIPEKEKETHDIQKTAIQIGEENALLNLKKMGKELSNMKKDIFKEVYRLLREEELYFYEKAQQILRSDAIERAVYKDIPQSYRIDSPLTLERFLYVLAGQVTGILSLKGISKDISHVSVQTLDRYLSYLTQTYLVFTIFNYDNNERNIQRRQRRAYFVDIAVRNAALQKDHILKDSTEMGKLYENLVASHLYHLGKQCGTRLYHWRRGKYEVDFIYDDPDRPLAFEIGASKTHSRSGLKKLLEENPKFHNGVYYVAPGLKFLSPEDSPSGIGELPLDLLLISVGLQQEKELSKFL